MQTYRRFLLQIDGHASSEGSAERNLMLSKDRVLAVRDYLIDRGVDPDRLSATGYGEASLKYDESTSSGRQMNRRVEFSWTQTKRR
jgi:outer membrane protein OmpA-like peptidoglycan-associated protein